MPPSTAEAEYTGQERAALVAWYLAHGECLTTRQVAAMTGLSWKGAYALMAALSRVVPVYLSSGHRWEVCAFQEMN